MVISLALPFLAGLVGSLATGSAIAGWYTTLTKPEFNPPNWVFAPVWTTLYLMMGIALYRVWRRGHSPILFIAHLVVNALWSIVFFGLHSPALGLAVILILLAMIVVITRRFWRVDRLAGYLLVPYLAWVAFVAVLNASIWWLNG